MARPGGESLFQLLPDENDGDLNELLTNVTEEAKVKMEVQRRQRWEEEERALQQQLKMENLFQLLPDDSEGDLNELLTKVTEEAKVKMEVQRRQCLEEKERALQEQLKPEERQQERARNDGRRTGQENPMAAKKLELPRQLLKSPIVFRKEKPVQEPGKNQDQNSTAAVSQGLQGFPPSKDFQGNQNGRRNRRWNYNNEAADQENQGGYRPRRYRHYGNEGGNGDKDYPEEGGNYQAYGPRRYRNHNNQGENAEEGNYCLRDYHQHGVNYQGYRPRRHRYYNNREGNGHQESIEEVSHEGSYQSNGGNQGYRPRRYRYYNNEGDNYQVENHHDHRDAGDRGNFGTNNGYEGNYRRRRNYRKKHEEQTGADQNSHGSQGAEVPDNSEKEILAASAADADKQEVNGDNKGPGEGNSPDAKNVEKKTNINGSKREKMKRDRKKGIVDTDKKKPEEAKEEENVLTMSYKEYQKIQEQKKAASEAQPQPETAEKKDDSKEYNLKEKDGLDKQKAPRTMKITEFHMLTSAAGDRSHTDRQRPKWAQNEGESPNDGNGRPRYEDQRSFEARRSGPRGGRNGGRGFPRQQFAPSDGQSFGDHGERPFEGRRFRPRGGRNEGRGFPRQQFAPGDGQSSGDHGERPFEGQRYGGDRSGGGGGGHDGEHGRIGFPRQGPEPGNDASKEEYMRQFPALEKGTKNPPHLSPAGAAIDAAAAAASATN